MQEIPTSAQKELSGLRQKSKNIPVIYILGNHEYYKGSYPKTLNKIKSAAENTNIHVLEDSFLDIEDIRFHGCTLWTDFALFGNSVEAGMYCQPKMNDYKMIKRDPSYSKMRTVDTFKIHQFSKHWLNESLENSTKEKNIVVTHHAPSLLSVPDNFKNDLLTSAYASNLDDFITKHQPDFWIHGHIHAPSRYSIGKTEVICNPHGYLDDPDNGYDRELIIET
ncbi:metallophosphoesterase [Chryseobacterium sp. TY3]